MLLCSTRTTKYHLSPASFSPILKIHYRIFVLSHNFLLIPTFSRSEAELYINSNYVQSSTQLHSKTIRPYRSTYLRCLRHSRPRNVTHDDHHGPDYIYHYNSVDGLFSHADFEARLISNTHAAPTTMSVTLSILPQTLWILRPVMSQVFRFSDTGKTQTAHMTLHVGASTSQHSIIRTKKAKMRHQKSTSCEKRGRKRILVD
jgi:hypothetical protein